MRSFAITALYALALLSVVFAAPQIDVKPALGRVGKHINPPALRFGKFRGHRFRPPHKRAEPSGPGDNSAEYYTDDNENYNLQQYGEQQAGNIERHAVQRYDGDIERYGVGIQNVDGEYQRRDGRKASRCAKFKHRKPEDHQRKPFDDKTSGEKYSSFDDEKFPHAKSADIEKSKSSSRIGKWRIPEFHAKEDSDEEVKDFDDDCDED